MVSAHVRMETPLKLLEKRSDISMNLILSDAKQINENLELVANYGKILIRGSNILYISIDPDKVSIYEQR